MKETEILAYCGLYCNNCGKFKNGKCPGCIKNESASWCKIRKCCIEHNYQTCAECKEQTANQCNNYKGFFSKFFEIVFKSDRNASIEYIKEHGAEDYVNFMKAQQSMVIKKRKK